MRRLINKNRLNQTQNNTKVTIWALLVLFLFASTPTYATTKEEAQLQINQINQQISNINSSLSDNAQKQDTIQGEIDAINAQINALQQEINATQYQITLTSAQIDETNTEIAKAEADLAKQKELMKEYLKTMYIEGQTTTVELIARSSSFSEFVDQSEYMNTMQQHVQETADKIAAIKSSLDQKKKDLEVEKAKAETLRNSQTAQQAAVVNQRNYQNNLMYKASVEEKSLKDQKQALYAKKAQLSLLFNENISRGGSAYPYGNPPTSNIIDTPDAYGYLIGECTSYSAWKRQALGNPVPRNLGNANTWGSRAAAQGYPVDTVPRVGDVMVFPYLGGYGHVAIVEKVNGDGTVDISEYNWVPYSYTYRSGVNPYNYSAVFIH